MPIKNKADRFDLPYYSSILFGNSYLEYSGMLLSFDMR